MLASVTPTHEQLQVALQSLVGPDLAVVCTGVDGHPETLWPEERDTMARAVLRRQREFAAGRAAARAAMRRLGWPDCAIPARQDRSPLWPTSLVGSISHSSECCAAVVALKSQWASVGVDIETDERAEPALWPSICTAAELKTVSRLAPALGTSWVTRIFSAKEAYFKWQYPSTEEMLDFQDVEIQLDPDALTFKATRTARRPGTKPHAPVLGSQIVSHGHIFSFVAHRPHIRHRPAEVL
ncbi:MAG: 4'-phosphopantetheinyl transferase family protein [Hydrogenophaga sp.]|jgi:4'-phosphopantetheinyl transferase EntD|uniref:4'-phosphopantetheinyl transferase family protein n=1 Tax=Hydrogenophaga sp. TaxID=1904254 RepID=UPI001DB85416|nr:4'-phosphopantetheinyl transferase superfamily protein [Hydrogenophaga sp.]MBW0172157.1 4'-phosphopantetheinyl transferase superfamily protein [Hydrogenophaga sp.]MBW0186156.1 4'-phosphopantetheinyl transferase superfamily protein [Hydrogenophaga sp.]